jgi:hypothetical protein
MKHTYVLIVSILMISNAVCADLKLENGIKQEVGLVFTEAQKLNLPKISNVIKKNGLKNRALGSIAFVSNSNENKWYRLYKNLNLFGVDTKNETLLGLWGLTRWAQELKNKDVADMYQIFSDPDFAQDYSYSPYQSTNPNFKQPPVMGCLSEIPLRYGDVDNNKTDELVLLLGHKDQVLDFVLFNPDQEKISFSARVIMSDIDDYHGTDSQYQYTSNFNMSKGEYAGTQTFAKVFMGEFDGFESSKDIIVWRKHYKTLKHSASDKGFKLESQNYQFYTLKDGEYKLQISLEAQIEQWMSANNLTWQSGFPSKSECAGQEGQLIPEMHDPLLNDPDVLK